LRIKSATAIFFLTIILTGCHKCKVDIRYVREPLPPNLVAPTPLPPKTGNTIGYLIEDRLVEVAGALDSCNADKTSLKKWGENK
jgi:hypothetical protein